MKHSQQSVLTNDHVHYQRPHKKKQPLFSKPPVKTKTKSEEKIKSLKHDRILFSLLYISCQMRGRNLEEFFRYEKQASAPSLSNRGNMYTGTKSDIVSCLTKSACGHRPAVLHPEELDPEQDTVFEVPVPSTLHTEHNTHINASHVDATLLDGAAIVNMIRPNGDCTFGKYAETQFVKYVESQQADRVDVVFDVYVAQV